MQEKRQYLSALSWTICLLVLAAMLGCGDTAKRSAGKELRKATKLAKDYYEKAQSLLANCPDGCNKPEVSQSLGKAEKILTAALRQYGKSSDPEDTPKGEIVNARNMLGMVYQLRGDCCLWKINAITREVAIQIALTDRLLEKVQRLYAGAVAYKQAMLGSEEISRMLSGAKKDKKAVTKEIATLNTKIEQGQADVKGLDKKINELSTSAAALRRESIVDVTGEAGLKKLQKAQAIEDEIYKNEELLSAHQDELGLDRKNLVLLQIRLEEANGKIAACETKKLATETHDKKHREALAGRETEIKNCWAGVLALQQSVLKDYPGMSQNSMERNCHLAEKLALAGENDFDRARKAFAVAARMDSSNVLLIDGQSEALIRNAALITQVVDLRTKVKNLSERITTIRKNMSDLDIPTEPVAPGIVKFIADNAELGPKIADSYRQALKLRTATVRKIRDPKLRMNYQLALIDLYEAYAASLKAIGSIDQATAEMKKADDLKAKLSKNK